MKAQMSLLSLAIASGLALSAMPAEAAGNLKSAAVSRANALLGANGTSMIRGAQGDVSAARDAIVDADGTEHVPSSAATAACRSSAATRDAFAQRPAAQRQPVLRSAAAPEPGRRFSADEAIIEAGARFGSKFFGAPTSRMVV